MPVKTNWNDLHGMQWTVMQKSRRCFGSPSVRLRHLALTAWLIRSDSKGALSHMLCANLTRLEDRSTQQEATPQRAQDIS